LRARLFVWGISLPWTHVHSHGIGFLAGSLSWSMFSKFYQFTQAEQDGLKTAHAKRANDG
jgi:hypothetical protein